MDHDKIRIIPMLGSPTYQTTMEHFYLYHVLSYPIKGHRYHMQYTKLELSCLVLTLSATVVGACCFKMPPKVITMIPIIFLKFIRYGSVFFLHIFHLPSLTCRAMAMAHLIRHTYIHISSNLCVRSNRTIIMQAFRPPSDAIIMDPHFQSFITPCSSSSAHYPNHAERREQKPHKRP